MRSQELEVLHDIQKLEKGQLLLMETPKTIQQQFLHLFGHRHLLKEKMIHKNLDRCLNLLPGSLAQNSLKSAYTVLCIQNQIEVEEGMSPLLQLIQGWINYYPTIKGREKVLLGEMVLQEELSIEDIQGYDTYLQYLNLISLDLWTVLKGSKNEEDFYKEQSFKLEMEDWARKDLKHLDSGDLLTFVSSCIPKVLLNIILEKSVLPPEMREKYPRYECLFSNQGVEFQLRTSQRLPILLKNIFLVLLQMELNGPHAKFLMLVAMRYYYVFHFQRKFSAAEIVIYAYNKLTDDLRRSLSDEFALFLKVILKLGKEKFCTFLSQNSAYMKAIIEGVKKKPVIGYPQESASPYNTIGIGETITLERGASTSRYFQVLEEFSLFYYRIVIENMDVTIKLYYLGEVGSSQEGRTLLFCQEKKGGEIKNCINTMKKGIYEFEFDNSYSWINGKTIRYENVVYSPLEIRSNTADQWVPDFYENLYQNQIAQEQDVYLVTHQKVELLGTTTTTNMAVLSKNKDLLSLAIKTQTHSYHYETDSALRMEQKVQETMKDKEKYQWVIKGKVVSNNEEINNFIFDSPSKPAENENKEQLEYFKDDDEEEELQEDQYEVVQKKMEQSHIFNENPQREQFLEQEEEEEERPKKKTELEAPLGKRTKKEEITCKAAETEDFYSEEKS